jgi:hypothetical protein
VNSAQPAFKKRNFVMKGDGAVAISCRDQPSQRKEMAHLCGAAIENKARNGGERPGYFADLPLNPEKSRQ